MCNEMEMVKEFYYLGNRLNASGGSEAAVTARTRLGLKKFRVWRNTFEKIFPLRMKEKVYKRFVRSAMLYGSKTWCSRENEVVFLTKSREIYGEGDKQEKYSGADGYTRVEESCR